MDSKRHWLKRINNAALWKELNNFCYRKFEPFSCFRKGRQWLKAKKALITAFSYVLCSRLLDTCDPQSDVFRIQWNFGQQVMRRLLRSKTNGNFRLISLLNFWKCYYTNRRKQQFYALIMRSSSARRLFTSLKGLRSGWSSEPRRLHVTISCFATWLNNIWYH